MKVSENIIARRPQLETEISITSLGLWKADKRRTRSLLSGVIEKHREKEKGLNMAFIGLEEDYGRAPRGEIWRCRREKSVSEKHVDSSKICTQTWNRK